MKIHVHQHYPKAFGIHFDQHQSIVTKVQSLDYTETPEGNQCERHLHHFHQLDVILDGEFILTLNEGRNETGKPGQAWIVPPLVSHRIDFNHYFRYASFKFYLAPHLWALFGTHFQRFRISPDLCHLIDAAGKRASTSAALASEQVAALISLCLIECADQLPVTEEATDNLDEFRRNLWPLLAKFQNDPNVHWSVQGMAREMHISHEHFSRCFRRVLNQSPQRYILESTMRISAARLLEAPEQPIKEIAERAGYANVHAFTRAFTQVFQISPAAYRNQAQSKSLKPG